MSGIADRSFLTSGEAAKLLGVSRQTILRWAHRGALPMAHTIGGHLRFRPADVRSLSHDLGGDLPTPGTSQPARRQVSAHGADSSDSPESQRSGV